MDLAINKHYMQGKENTAIQLWRWEGSQKAKRQAAAQNPATLEETKLLFPYNKLPTSNDESTNADDNNELKKQLKEQEKLIKQPQKELRNKKQN